MVDAEKEKQEQADRLREQQLVAAARKPADLGMTLSATIVGARTKLATINGKQYREAAEIELKETNGAPTTETLVLKTIGQKFVVLERQGKLFRLSLSTEIDGKEFKGTE